MPISRSDNIPIVIEEVLRINPKSILDVGIGFGMWGCLFRAFTDIRMAEIKDKRYTDWETIIDGIEIFKDYANPNYANYNNIYYGDALKMMEDLLRQNKVYDLVYLGDIIEHFKKEDGHILLDMAVNLGKQVIVSTPNYFREQTSVLNNINERHLSFWEDADFPMNSRIINTKYQKIILIN